MDKAVGSRDDSIPLEKSIRQIIKLTILLLIRGRFRRTRLVELYMVLKKLCRMGLRSGWVAISLHSNYYLLMLCLIK